MKAAPQNPLHTDPQCVARFLQTCRFRHRGCRKVYSCILSGFQRFCSSQSPGEPPSIPMVRAWLEERVTQWPLHMVIHRARLVDRFLEWMTMCKVIPKNPFSELRSRYGVRATTPLVRALLNKSFEAALERLRPPPRFASFLGDLMQQHVARMRSLGNRYDHEEQSLLLFDRFLQTRPDLAGLPLRNAVQEWMRTDPCPQHTLKAQRCGRIVSKALHRLDPKIPILQIDAGLERRVRQQHRQAHIYSEDEMRRVLWAAQTFPSPKAPLRPLTLYTMFIVAYCAGLRIGELVALTVADVHLEDDTLEIRDTKFFKSRRLPLAPSVMAALKLYLAAREAAGASTEPGAGLFWQQRYRRQYTRVAAGQLLIDVLRRAGVKPKRGRIGPRFHDVRHAFVAKRMLTWYSRGINPQSRLAYLATYLGHKDINSTLVYLTVTQELLQLAGERFRQYGSRAMISTGERS